MERAGRNVVVEWTFGRRVDNGDAFVSCSITSAIADEVPELRL